MRLLLLDAASESTSLLSARKMSRPSPVIFISRLRLNSFGLSLWLNSVIFAPALMGNELRKAQ